MVEVGASNAHLDSPEDGDIEVEANGTASNCDVVSDICSIPEDVGTLEVAFLYDAPMREMTVYKKNKQINNNKKINNNN